MTVWAPSYGAVSIAEPSHEDDGDEDLKERQANHDDVGNPLICRLHSEGARNAECHGGSPRSQRRRRQQLSTVEQGCLF